MLSHQSLISPKIGCSTQLLAWLSALVPSPGRGAAHVTITRMSVVYLSSHPETPCPAVSLIEVHYALTATGGLSLSYRLAGKLDQLIIPEVNPLSSRRDELWRHTCLEAFIASAGETAYREFNFSPSGDWAVYAFDGYRSGMAVHGMAGALEVGIKREAREFQLDVMLPPGAISASTTKKVPLRLALSVVLEMTHGAHSYWALRHPPGKPDFHHADGFALHLAG